MPGKLLVASLGAIAFFFGGVAGAEAATLEGKVTTPDARAVSGAMVTVFSDNRMHKETVFTNADGRYLIVT
ncbi:MAG: carboxypeptidase regulatory-like domain-containing protein, partial [Deltaproteobacteria bacterium]|nr:carboxypeptidase regulatory-like domain-containing protein [Deltaproteobacteria bacterium]